MTGVIAFSVIFGTFLVWPVWLNGWVFVYELSGCGLESSCSHLNFRFRACLEQGIPCHSDNYVMWNAYMCWDGGMWNRVFLEHLQKCTKIFVQRVIIWSHWRAQASEYHVIVWISIFVYFYRFVRVFHFTLPVKNSHHFMISQKYCEGFTEAFIHLLRLCTAA